MYAGIKCQFMGPDKRLKIICIIAILIFQSLLQLKGQESSLLKEEPILNFIGLNLSWVNPLGPFKENTKAGYLGCEIHYYRQFRKGSPLFLGFSTYYTMLGNRKAVITEFLDNTIIDFKYSTNSHLWGFNTVGRFYPDLYVGKAEFFTELLIGGKWFFTTTTKTIPDTEDSDIRMDRGRLSLDYGIALGMNYPVYKSLYASIKSSYLPGTAGSYYARNDKSFIEYTTLEGFTLKNSAVELLRWDLGITFTF
jgi:hypothetical protein